MLLRAYVYQGVARGLDKDFIDTAHKFIFQGFIPLLTVILDISYEKGCFRIENDQKSGIRDEAESRFDNEKKSFHKLVRQGFLNLASNDDTGRFFVVDADNSQEKIFERIKNKIIKEKIIDIEPVITHRFPLEDFAKGMELMKSGNCGKIILLP